jgi:hypothetical protein
MKSLIAAAASSAVLVAAGSAAYVLPAPGHVAQTPPVAAVTPPRSSAVRPAHPHARVTPRAPAVSNEALTAVVKATCATCHSERQKSGNLVLANFDVANAASTPETAEKMIAKLRAGMMPPPGRKRPGGDPRTTRRSRRLGQAGAGHAFLPATQSCRVRAVHPRPPDAGSRCRQMASTRHEERQLRQHRRRADTIGHGPRRLPRRGE